jgi:hypothetical protein
LVSFLSIILGAPFHPGYRRERYIGIAMEGEGGVTITGAAEEGEQCGDKRSVGVR